MKTIGLVMLMTIMAAVVTVNGWAADGSVELKPQTTCPVMGEKIDRDVYVDYKGQRVYFCCTSCAAKFKADPEKYLKVMAKNGEKPLKLEICPKCGEYKGTAKCCKGDVAKCPKCGMHKGSPGCCKAMAMKHGDSGGEDAGAGMASQGMRKSAR